jgi:hypothetical protein
MTDIIKIKWAQEGIFGPGPEGIDGYDVRASLEELEASLRTVIGWKYPHAQIEIEVDFVHLDGVTVFCDDDDSDTEDKMKREICDLASVVWQRWDWIVGL